MSYTDDRLNDIFDKTDGHCHLCHGRLSFGSYANKESRGGWEAEHSRPRAQGGTDHLNNLFAAHIPCNRQKQTNSSRSERALNGHARAPHSKKKKDAIRLNNTVSGGLAGGLIGGLVGGPLGAALGAGIGAVLGDAFKVPK